MIAYNRIALLIAYLAFLKVYLPIIAEQIGLVIVCDHKHTGNYQYDTEKKCFGIAIVIPDGNDKKCPFFLEYM